VTKVNKQRSKIRRKHAKLDDEIKILAAMDFEPLPSKFDAEAFNTGMEANRRHAYLAFAFLHASKTELIQAYKEAPEALQALADSSLGTADNFRWLADSIESARARIICAAASCPP